MKSRKTKDVLWDKSSQASSPSLLLYLASPIAYEPELRMNMCGVFKVHVHIVQPADTGKIIVAQVICFCRRVAIRER
jgi:hypothetical protein